MRGAIAPLQQYTFLAWCSVKRKNTATTLPLQQKQPPKYSHNILVICNE